jgi:predicted metalloprotease with PDZ domain
MSFCRTDVSDSVQIRLDLTQPASQTVWVHMEWTPQWNRQILQLPVWTPGSYTVRDHAQHLHSLRLSNGSSIQTLRRLSPSRWLCELTTLEPLSLTYAIESRDLTVRTGLLDPDFASLSLASVAMEIEGLPLDAPLPGGVSSVPLAGASPPRIVFQGLAC